MATLRCPNCGSEVLLPEKSSLSVGMTLSEESKGDYVLPMRDSKTTEYGTKNTTTENKENTTMNSTMNFDMETLAKMVAAQLSGMNVAQNVTEPVKEEKLYPTVADGGQWAKGSKYYGKEICGFVFNPYMIRWHLQRQFEELMEKAKTDKYNPTNIHGVIQREYPYMYSVKYTLEEVRKLAMLQKKDKIAYDERRRCFDLSSCKTIFADYLKEVKAMIEKEERKLVAWNKPGKMVDIYIRTYGLIPAGTISEKIVNHRVEKYLERTSEFESIYCELDRMIDRLTYSGIYDYKSLYDYMNNKIAIKVPADTKKSKAFMNCFIKSGAYYTLKQMLMFDENTSFRGLNGRDAVLALRKELNNPSVEGYMIYGMLKKAKNIF